MFFGVGGGGGGVGVLKIGFWGFGSKVGSTSILWGVLSLNSGPFVRRRQMAAYMQGTLNIGPFVKCCSTAVLIMAI